jgi:hypothetical protein
MMTWVVAVALSAAPAPVKLAAPGLLGVNVSKEVAQFYSNHVAQLLALQGVSVITASEIASMIGLERQKELLACGDAAGGSCMAELANALGVDGVVTGSIGEFDGLTQINLKVVAASDGRTLAIYSGSAGSQSAVLEELKVAAASLVKQLTPQTGARGVRRLAWIPGGVGVVCVGVGIAMMSLVSGHVSDLRGAGSGASTLSLDDANRAMSDALTERTLGWVFFAVGGAAVLGAAAMFAFGAPVSISPSVSVGGAGVTIGGRF